MLSFLISLLVLAAMTAIFGSCVSVSSISEFCGPNPGGTHKLYVINVRDVLTMPAPGADGLTITTDIVPKDGKAFVQWEFAQDTGEIRHRSVGEPGNKSVVQEADVYIPRGISAIDKVVQESLNGRFIIIVEDGLGQKRVGGSLLRPMIFDHDYKSGKKGTDKNGTDFKFAVEGIAHLPYYYNGVVPVTPAV